MKNIKLTVQNALTKIKAMSVTSKILIGAGSLIVVSAVTGMIIYASYNPKTNNKEVVSTTTSTLNKNDKDKSDTATKKEDSKKTNNSSEKNKEDDKDDSAEKNSSAQDSQQTTDTANNNVTANNTSNNSNITQTSQNSNNTTTQPSNNNENNSSNNSTQSNQQSNPPVDCNTFKSQIMACFLSTINNCDINTPMTMTVTPTYYSNFVSVTEQFFNGGTSEGTMRNSITSCTVADSFDEYTTYATNTNKISCGSILGTNAQQIASQIPIGNTGAVNLRVTWNGNQYECKYVAVMTSVSMYCD